VARRPREDWLANARSGTISFGRIAIPIKLFTAVRHKAVSFN
jgi:non-homologous end joining protein Ku